MTTIAITAVLVVAGTLGLWGFATIMSHIPGLIDRTICFFFSRKTPEIRNRNRKLP